MKRLKLVLAFMIMLNSPVVIAQLTTQSKLLPISNGEVINFHDLNSPIISLPMDPSISVPIHDETTLRSTICFDEYTEDYLGAGINMKYVGQHPAFCQAVVHDKNGNILFQIVDNNIYNRYGESFINTTQSSQMAEYHYWLHQGTPDRVNAMSNINANSDYVTKYIGEHLNREVIDGINGYGNRIILGPEIIVVPVPESCNKFYLIYGTERMTEQVGLRGNFSYFYRTLTYTDPKTIEINQPSCLNDLDNEDLCHNNSRFSMAITEYRPTEGNYILFIDDEELEIFEVNATGIDVMNKKKLSYSLQNNGYQFYNKCEMEIINDGQNYLLAMAASGSNPFFHVIRFPYDFSSIQIPASYNYSTANIYDNDPYYSVNWWHITFTDSNFGKTRGIEFSPNADKLFVTFENQDDIYYVDLSSLSTQSPLPVIGSIGLTSAQAAYYQHSHIELGRDGQIYYQGDDGATPIPNTYLLKLDPTNLTVSQNSYPGLYKQQDFNNSSNYYFLDLPQYIFMDQVDGSAYEGIATATPSSFCCNSYDEWPEVTSFSPYELWSPGYGNNPFNHFNGSVILNENCTIPKGVQIVMQDMTFHFENGAGLYLEAGDVGDNGAFLRLNNSILSGMPNCENGYFWDGVKLIGSNTPQGIAGGSLQPYIKLENESVIEDALIGIESNHGGIIKAYKSSFLNNRQSIVFNPFQNHLISGGEKQNESEFLDCLFSINMGYLGNGQDIFKEHVYLDNVDGIVFNTCDFENLTTSRYFSLTSNFGISSMNSGFFVDGSCNISLATGQVCPMDDLKRTSFNGFSYGIYVRGTDSKKPIRVSTSYFNDNFFGIMVISYDQVEVLRNIFNVGNTTMHNTIFSDPKPIGLQIVSASGYRIEENTFEGYSNINGYPSVGSVLEESGEDNNEIYLNEFTNLNFGVNPVGLNRSTQSSLSGLQVLCNEFVDLTNCDIFVMHSLYANNNEGIRDFQGNFFDNHSAGNCFTQTNAAPEANLKNGVSQPFFYYFNGVVDPSNCYYPALHSPGIISVQQVNGYYCPSHISDGDELPFDETRENTVIIDYYMAETAYFNLLYSYLQQIDGGSTPSLLTEIQNTWPQEAWDLRNDLMSIAPFVSREALEEAAFSNILPDAMLLEVCLANPDATREEELLRILSDDIPNTLPSYMIDMIRDNWDTETTRTLLENGLAHYGAIRDRKCNLLIANAKMKEGATN